MTNAPRRPVAIFRHQLFKPSETFVTEQASALSGFAPVFVGRKLEGTPFSGADYLIPPRLSGIRLLSYMGLMHGAPFVAPMRERGVKLIHAHFGVEGMYATDIAKRLDVPLVTTLHGFDVTLNKSDLLSSKKISWVNYALNRPRLARQGNLFVCVSKFIYERTLALGFPEERMVQHYIGVDTAKFGIRQEHPDQQYILHVARLVEKKGTRYLIEAFGRIAKRHPQAKLIIVGDGPLRGELQQLVETSGLSGAVEFLGMQPHGEVRRWMQQSSVFCLPSVTAASGDSEGLPIALLEAASSGLPAVVTRHAGIPEGVRDGETGYIVAERDVNGMSEAIDSLLADADLRQRMGGAARRLAETEFDLRTQTAKLEKLYEGVL